MNNVGTMVLVSGIGGMIPGAIGAAVADSAGSHPILKGALVTGAFNALLTLVFASGIEAAQQTKQVGTNGPPRQLRFP